MICAEVLVIGAGPSGIAAATAAARCGRDVLVLDDNPAPGGQIWRADATAAHGPRDHAHRDARRNAALARFRRSGARLLSGHRVFAAPAPGVIQAIREQGAGEGTRVSSVTFHYRQLILATGARERFLPFPGWTLPGVFGAGGLQALVKGGFSVAGKRVIVAGSGPLLLAVAAHLRAYGATVVSIAEQAPAARLALFAASLCRQPATVWQGLRYRLALAATPYRSGCWPVEAVADSSGNTLEKVRLTSGNKTWEEPCDLLACGFHLVPNTELASLLGVVLRDGFVQVDEEQRTSVPGVFCVGEPTGIAGLDAALLQGEIAGRAAAGRSNRALQSRAASTRAFGIRLNHAFALRTELRSLAAKDTILCRCEDVPLGRLDGCTGWTDAKLQTRCGMGPCQGRICGPAVEFLLGWKPASVRPPLFPVPMHALMNDFETLKENR